MLLLVAFAIDNRGSVRVGWVFGDFRRPMIVVLLVTAVVGARGRVAGPLSGQA